MTATEAREKLNLRNAKLTIKRIFPLIEKKIEQGLHELDVGFGASEGCLTEPEFFVLHDTYGYRLTPTYDDSGDYHRSDKHIGYNISW